MTDKFLTAKDNNFIDATRKIASLGVFHNFMKNTEVIAFNSELANKMAKDLSEKSSSRVSWLITELSTMPLDYNRRLSDIVSWLDKSCSGYYFMVDYNVFFELEEDSTSFILRFSS